MKHRGQKAGRNTEAIAPNSGAVDWEWIYGEMVDPGVEHPPTVTSVFDGVHDTGALRSGRGTGDDKP